MEEQKKKFPVVKFIIILLLVAFTATSYVFYDKIFGENSIFNTPVESDFLKVVYGKIPALIQSVQIITIAVIIHYIIKLFTVKTLAKSKRGVTISKLLNSFVKWIVTIVTVLLILNAWGVDTTTLIASAGILTLMISLGAQSLVADIIAGLFIVVEGEYQVGDIVVIDDWRGTVTEIGIRTTKIEDAGGNIKIINNSEIKSVINQTQSLSVAKVVMSIEYDESIPRVELVIRDSLDKIKERISAIVDGPFYKGVTALSASSVDLLFLANCHEEDIYQVQRDLNRELKLMFDENDINIPFQQIVVSKPQGGKKQSVAVADGDARQFVEEQKNISKNIEEKPE